MLPCWRGFRTRMHNEAIALRKTALLISQILLLCLYVGIQTASAGHYVVSYSGGQIVTTIINKNSKKIHLTPMQTQLSFIPASDDGSTIPSYNGQMTYAIFKAGSLNFVFSELDGPLTATFTWVPDHQEPPPSYIVVNRRFYLLGYVNWKTQPLKLTINSGLGLPLEMTRQGPQNASYSMGGANCLLIAHPAAHFSLSVSPKIVLPGEKTNLEGGGFIQIVFQAFATPIQMNLEGGAETPSGTEFMVGQRIKASIAADHLTPKNLHWRIEGDCHPFKFWDLGRGSAHYAVARYVPLARKDFNANEFYFYTRTPSRHNRVTCTFDIALPPDSLPKGGFHHLTITSPDFAVLHPVITHPFSAWVLHDAANNTTALLDDSGVLDTYGILLLYGIDVPVPFSRPDSGGFPSLSICQTIQPNRRYILADHRIATVPFLNQTGLDDQILFPNNGMLYVAVGLAYSFFNAPSIAPPPNSSNIAEIEVNDTFHDFLLFWPLGGCPIPIQEITWHWQARATHAHDHWTLLPHSRLFWQASPYYPRLPQWSRRISRESLNDVGFRTTRSEALAIQQIFNNLWSMRFDLTSVGQKDDDNGDLANALKLYKNALARLDSSNFREELLKTVQMMLFPFGELQSRKPPILWPAHKDRIIEEILEAFCRSQKAEIAFKVGQIQLEEGKVAEALKSFKQSEQLEPEDSMVSLYLAFAYYRLGDVKQARDCFARYAQKSGRAFTETDYDAPEKLDGMILLSLAAEGNWGLLGSDGDKRRAIAYEIEAETLFPNDTLPPYRE